MRSGEEWRVKAKENKQPFRFFKIVLPSILDSNTLRVPEKFVNECRPELPGVATLTTPGGLCWEAVFAINEDKIYFSGQGWVDFMKHHDIRYGYFLEFEYQGNNLFNVYIFNLTCSEVDYTASPQLELDPHHHADGDGKRKNSACMENIVQEEEHRKKISHSDDTPYFTVTVRKCNIMTAAAYLHIPKSFTNKYMKRKLHRYVKLRAGNGREWHVIKCSYFSTGFRLFGLRWKKFQQQNNWKQGQIYTFVLLKNESNGPLFEVVNNTNSSFA